MQTENEKPENQFPSAVIVWNDPNGAKFAAQLTEPGRAIFAEYETYARGTVNAKSLDDLQATVTGSFYAKVYTKDGLPWIEQRDLIEAARDQNPVPSWSLSDAISYPERVTLTDDTRAELVRLLTKRCRAATAHSINRALRYPAELSNCGLFRRVMISPRVEYVAGQDYRAEIVTVRQLLIKG